MLDYFGIVQTQSMGDIEVTGRPSQDDIEAINSPFAPSPYKKSRFLFL